MMNLFRKYQKTFLGILTVFIIASFVFFGTYDAIVGRGGAASVPDVAIGKAVDGSVMKQREIQNLISMLETDAQDVMIIEGKATINLLNDGVVRSDILSSEIGRLLVGTYYEELKGDLEGKWERYKTFKPYRHPSQSIGLEALWKQFVPQLARDFEKFKSMTGGFSVEGFDALSKLYIDQAGFPPRLARQFLAYHQQQYGMGEDAHLMNGDLSLFYAKTLSDWFGSRFTEVVAGFIHNAAAYAKSKGYSVSFEEAKASLMQIGMENIQRIERDKEITGEDFSKFYQHQIAGLGMSEKEAVQAWQKVLLFRRLVIDVEKGIVVDAPFFKEMQKDAAKGVHVELYRLPKEYRGLNDEDLRKLEKYLAVTESSTPEEVIKKASQLVVKKFKVKVAHLEKKNLPTEVSLKRTWAWEIEDRNWKTLMDSFPEVAKCKATDREVRFSYLSGLSDKSRAEIDQFARMRIIDETPEFIYERLDSVEAEAKVMKIGQENLPGVKDNEKLTRMLEKEPTFVYTDDHENYYRFEVVERMGLEVLSFAEAKGVIEKADASAMKRLVSLMEKAKKGEKTFVEREELKLTGDKTHALFDDSIFGKDEGYVSQVEKGKEGPFFYRVGKHFVHEEAISTAMQEAREQLGREASGKLIKALVLEIKEKGAIHFNGPEATSSN